jgi:hypothetical protein
MPDLRRIRFLAVVSLAAALPACSSSTPTTGTAPRASLLVTVDPNPLPPVQDPLIGTVTVNYKIVITETAGLGGAFNFVSSTVFDPTTGLQLAANYFDGSDLIVFVGTARIEPLGTMTVPQTTSFLLPDLTANATMTVAVQLKDDRDNLVNTSILVPIQTPAPATE